MRSRARPAFLRIVGRTTLAALVLVGCSGREHAGAAVPMAGYGAYDASGLASWYGEEAAGHRTASGDRFDPDGLSAAHRSLPLGSFAQVTSIATGRSVVVRINDRGPGRADRLIDLSRGAARALGTDRLPLAAVRIRALAPGSRIGIVAGEGGALPAPTRIAPPMSASGSYIVQVASFSSRDRAQALADRIDGQVAAASGSLWRVRLGPIAGASAAQVARDAMAARGYGDARILPAD